MLVETSPQVTGDGDRRITSEKPGKTETATVLGDGVRRRPDGSKRPSSM